MLGTKSLKFGGCVMKDMNGKQRSVTEPAEVRVVPSASTYINEEKVQNLKNEKVSNIFLFWETST